MKSKGVNVRMEVLLMKTDKKVLILKGGWDGHQPELVSKRFAGIMERNGYKVEISGTLDILANADKLMELDLVIACWTMDKIEND